MTLHQNEVYIRYLVDRLSSELSLPKEAVRAVIDGVALLQLDSIRKMGIEDGVDYRRPIVIQVPHIGKMHLHYSTFDGNTPINKPTSIRGFNFLPKFKYDERFLLKLRYAYFLGKDYYLDSLEKNFKGIVSDYYKSVINMEDLE